MSYIDAIGMKTHLQNLKNSFSTMFYISGQFWPIPAIICINKNRKNHKKSQKIQFFKNRYFFMWWPEILFFCRKVSLWTPESATGDPPAPEGSTPVVVTGAGQEWW